MIVWYVYKFLSNLKKIYHYYCVQIHTIWLIYKPIIFPSIIHSLLICIFSFCLYNFLFFNPGRTSESCGNLAYTFDIWAQSHPRKIRFFGVWHQLPVFFKCSQSYLYVHLTLNESFLWNSGLSYLMGQRWISVLRLFELVGPLICGLQNPQVLKWARSTWNKVSSCNISQRVVSWSPALKATRVCILK